MAKACRKLKVNQISTSETDMEPEDDETSYSHTEHAASIIDCACQMEAIGGSKPTPKVFNNFAGRYQPNYDKKINKIGYNIIKCSFGV